MRTIPMSESLIVEFKRDRHLLPDSDLIKAVICLANSEGGALYIGVEDNGTITGLHPRHQNSTSLAAMIANRTNPPLSTRVTMLDEEGHRVAMITVPKSQRPVATSDGLFQRRTIGIEGKPQCVPMYLHELVSHQSDLGMLDYSSFNRMAPSFGALVYAIEGVVAGTGHAISMARAKSRT